MKKRLYMALCICLSVILICGANNAAAKSKGKTITLNVNETVKLKDYKVKKVKKVVITNKKIVSVSKKGVLKAKKKGKTKVVLKYKKCSKTINVIVNAKKNNDKTAVKNPIDPKLPTNTNPTKQETKVTISAYVCDIQNDTLYLSQDKSYLYTCTLAKVAANNAIISSNGSAIAWSNIEVGDYIEVTTMEPLQYSSPAVCLSAATITVKSKNPEMKNKQYDYKVTEINGTSYTVQSVDNNAKVTIDSSQVLGTDKCRFYLNDNEIEFGELKVGDTVRLYQPGEIQSNPNIKYSVAKVVVVR